ncbi:MAG: transporter substrate-binding domain-containing protein [Deltaproteobacteria bacterium]|jgi:polar amino acid transport system substrate-binding protein
MKSFGFPRAIGLMVVLAIIGFAGSSFIVNRASAEEIITIATLEYAPWTGKNLKSNGFVNHVITEAFKQKGYTAKYTYLPWARGVEETKDGKYAALSYVYWSKDREREFYLSDPISEEKIVFFHLKSNPIKDWKTLEDLKNYKIGATRGYTYTKEFWDAAKSKRLMVEVTNSDLQNFKKLLSGRIDIFPSGLVNGKSLLQKDFDVTRSQLLTFHPKPLSKTTGCLAFTRSGQNSENLLRIFNQGLAELKKAGLYDKFMDDLFAGKYSQ